MYRLYISKHEMKSIGFKYDYILKDYVYEFPVYKYGRKPVVICKLGINPETYEIWFNVCSNGALYAAYYNRELHNNNLVVGIIEKNIQKEFKKLGIVKEREW